MKRIYGFCIFIISFNLVASSEIADLSVRIEKLTDTISILTDMLNTTNSIAERANGRIDQLIKTVLNASIVLKDTAGALKSVGTAVEDTNHIIKDKINLAFAGQITAVIVGGGTAMALGIYSIYRLLHYKCFQNIEMQKDIGTPSQVSAI